MEQSLVRLNGVMAHRQPGLGFITPMQGTYLLNAYSVLKVPERENTPSTGSQREPPFRAKKTANFQKYFFESLSADLLKIIKRKLSVTPSHMSYGLFC